MSAFFVIIILWEDAVRSKEAVIHLRTISFLHSRFKSNRTRSIGLKLRSSIYILPFCDQPGYFAAGTVACTGKNEPCFVKGLTEAVNFCWL